MTCDGGGGPPVPSSFCMDMDASASAAVFIACLGYNSGLPHHPCHHIIITNDQRRQYSPKSTRLQRRKINGVFSNQVCVRANNENRESGWNQLFLSPKTWHFLTHSYPRTEQFYTPRL
ncbi:unnamed protein product [Ectocarpus fasciculatus]